MSQPMNAGFIGESNIIEGTMIRDYLVAFDGFEFECVDKGFEDNEEIEVVLRPEDLDIVDPGQADQGNRAQYYLQGRAL